ncbi:MAG: DUF305 domain-containing protein [Alphaproteobacteria bacterium]|nr:DUF305 domain-containing protein [Alphaproteobacteria bacterium]
MKSPYKHLAVMTLVHIAIMYVAMFAMINRGSYFYNNTNMFYMAVLMAAPVTLFMLISMRHMYPNQKLNVALCIGFAFLTLASYGAIRTQAAVGDKQFLRAMIPHHSGAILMCREADIKDAEIVTLCKGIIESQQREIDQMEGILKRL